MVILLHRGQSYDCTAEIAPHSIGHMGAVSLGYDDVGTGDVLVLLHGHPFDRSMWRPQLERPGWRVIAPDLRGYGQSPVVPGVTSFETFARDIKALLDRLEVDRFVLGG